MVVGVQHHGVILIDLTFDLAVVTMSFIFLSGVILGFRKV